jgi:hypothetical protein
MKRILMTMIGAGVVYLLKNKEARQNVMSKIKSLTTKAKTQV